MVHLVNRSYFFVFVEFFEIVVQPEVIDILLLVEVFGMVVLAEFLYIDIGDILQLFRLMNFLMEIF